MHGSSRDGEVLFELDGARAVRPCSSSTRGDGTVALVSGEAGAARS
jgi:hypothetical protein